MPSEDSRKFSTVPRESLWWRANITKDDVHWVRQNLGRSMDGIKVFGTIPASLHLTHGPLGRSWDVRVKFVDGESAPRVNLPIGDRYDYRQDYERARRERDPHLSPHGLFRGLENNFHTHALQFMQQFGALTWMSTTLTGGAEWVSLSDFWDKHARFVGASRLWEARSDDRALKEAWQWIYERRDQINRVGPAHFGWMPLWEVDKYSPPPERLPWELDEGELDRAMDDLADFGILRRLSLEVVQNELNMHTADCRQIWLSKSIGKAGEDLIFRPTRAFQSLWGAIWDLFGQDASALTHSWRSCLECGRLFYPKDHRSVCCTTVHQALWSKRKWAREHRKPKLLSKPPISRHPKKRAVSSGRTRRTGARTPTRR